MAILVVEIEVTGIEPSLNDPHDVITQIVNEDEGVYSAEKGFHGVTVHETEWKGVS